MARARDPAGGSGEGDAALLARLSTFLAAEKTLSLPIAWVGHGENGFRFTRTLDLAGVTAQGLTLFGSAVVSLPNREVTLGLRWQDGAGRGGNFERFDWRPIRPHVNRAAGPTHLRLLLIDGSHRHSLAHNSRLEMGLIAAMRLNLPVAEAMHPDPLGWRALMEVAEASWRIQGLGDTPEPPWEADLFA